MNTPPPAPAAFLPSAIDPVVPINEAARLLSVSTSTLYALMDSGRLPYTRIMKQRRIRHSDIRALIEGGLVNARQQS